MSDSVRKIKSKLKPIENLSLTDKVELRLLEIFREGELKPGDPIPKEMELSQILNVSRTVLREALSRLRTLGLIDSKKHKGMVLTEPDVLVGLDRLLNPRILGEETLQDIFELRLVLEMGIAELLFARKTKEDVEELKLIAHQEEEYGDHNFPMEFEARFHGRIYEITGNRTLQRFQKLLLPIFKYVNDKGFRLRNDELPEDYVNHRILVQYIEHGTPETYRHAMKNHLQVHFRRILEGVDYLKMEH